MIKQRNDAATQYEKAERLELAQKELQEIEILKSYMPEPLSSTELLKLITSAIFETGASSAKDISKEITRKLKSSFQANNKPAKETMH